MAVPASRGEDRRDDSLANVPPTPISDSEGSSMGWLPWGVAVVIVGGGMWALMDNSTGCVRGATRSSKLRWQSRQVEIDAAAVDCAAASIELGTLHSSEQRE
jgi:hypothetical protein